MTYVETNLLKNSTIMLLYSEKDEIVLDPEYQRMGGVWTKEKKQLLIDSILNDYDIPKIYFHDLGSEHFIKTGERYAVIDGRQRLETVWEFMDGEFSLADDFQYQRDENINLAGLSYEDIAKAYPRIRVKFDSFVLPIVTVVTQDGDLDLIEDMFSRLNEAVPLNAAEKRNAIGGALVRAISEVSQHDLFGICVRFSNKRYQHREVAARFLLIEDSLQGAGKLIDTKKVYIDALARKYHTDVGGHVRSLQESVEFVLDDMLSTFNMRDELLQAQGNMVVYYLVSKIAHEQNCADLVTRRGLLDFRESLRANRTFAEENYAESSYELLEYDRLSQQGTNDASNIKERVEILSSALGIPVPEGWPAGN